MTVKVDTDNFARSLNLADQLVEQAVVQAINAEARDIANKADELVPFDDGDLSASQKIEFARRGDLTATVTYGGLAAPYALVQHERLDYKHRAGRTAKYLENPAKDAQRGFVQRIKRRIAAVT